MELTEIGVHPWTIDWWRSLPSAYQTADAAQRSPRLLYQVGFNADPTFTDGLDGWEVTAIPAPAGQVGLAFERPFFAFTPGAPMYYQVWYDSDWEGAVLNLKLTDSTGAVIASGSKAGIPKGLGNFTVIADGGATHDPVTAHLSFTVPLGDEGLLFSLKAVSLSHESLSYDGLPGVNATTNYPLLRYMEGIGRIAGEVRDLVDSLWGGQFMNPPTTPGSALPWLAQILGVDENARMMSEPNLRQYLVDLMDQGQTATGTRSHIANTAKQFLTGERRVSVVPSKSRQHSIILVVREDEVPGADLAALVAKVRSTGVMPAGHELTVSTAVPTWDEWTAAAGATWNERESAARTWSEADSLGVNIEEGV